MRILNSNGYHTVTRLKTVRSQASLFLLAILTKEDVKKTFFCCNSRAQSVLDSHQHCLKVAISMAGIDWDSHQQKLNASSLSIRKYCENNNINYNTARNKLKKNKASGVTASEKLQQKPRQTKQNNCNLNAAKHFGYARHYALELLSDTEIGQNSLNQEIAVARMQLALVIQKVSSASDNIEMVLGSSEPIQRLLGRIENLISSQNRLDSRISNFGGMLESVYSSLRSGDISAVEAAYRYMEKGIDVPPLLQAEAKLEIGCEDESESDLAKGGVTPQIVEERERELQAGSTCSSEQFLKKRMAELEELNNAERNETL